MFHTFLKFLATLGMLFGLTLSAPTAFPKDRGTLAELEQVLKKAKNIDQFLKNPTLIDEYFAALQSYYGEGFSRQSYDAIIKQLRELVKKVPQVKERLWEKVKLKPMVIEQRATKHHRVINVKTWRNYLDDYSKQLDEIISRYFGSRSSEEVRKRAARIIQGASKEIEKFERSIEKLGKKKKRVLSAEFYEKLKSRRSLRASLAHLLSDFISSKEARKVLQSGNADTILDWISELERSPGKMMRQKFKNISESTLSLAKAQAIRLEDLLDREDIFPKVVKYRKIVFRPIPRRIHGIWKGVMLGECVGGSCMDDKFLKSTTPARWSTSALSGSRVYHVEGSGKYLGFVQLVPLEKVNSKELYASVDFGAPVLSDDIVLPGKNGSQNRTSSLFSAWLDRVKPRTPRTWKGILVGESNAINNAKVLNTVRGLPEYVLGDTVGSNELFQHHDPLARAIADASPFEEYGADYKGNMIFDASVSDAGNLVEIRADRGAISIQHDLVENPDRLRSLLLDSSDLERSKRIISELNNRLPLPDSTQKAISEILSHEAVSEFATEVQNLLTANHTAENITSARSIDEILESAAQVDTSRAMKEHRGLRSLLVSRSEDLIERGIDLERYRQYLELAHHSIDDVEEMIETGFKLVKSPDQFLKLIDWVIETPSDAYRKMIDGLVLENLDNFFKMNPTLEQARKLHDYTKYIGTIDALLRKSLPIVKSAEDYLYIANTSVENPSDAFKKMRNKFVRDTVGTFVSMNPSVADLKKLEKSLYLIDDSSDLGFVIRERMLSQAKPSKVRTLLRRVIPNWVLKKFSDSRKPDSKSEYQIRRLFTSIKKLKDFEKRYVHSIEASIDLQRRGLVLVKRPKDYIKLVTFSEKYPSDAYKKAMSDFIGETIDNFFSTNPSIKDIMLLQKEAVSHVEQNMLLSRRGISKVKKPSDFIDLVQFTVKNPSDSYKSAMNKFAIENMDVFFGQKRPPTIYQMIKLKKYLPYVEGIEALMRRGAAVVKTADEYIKLMDPGVSYPSDHYMERIGKVVRDTLDQFLKTSPTEADIARLAKVTRSKIQELPSVERYLKNIPIAGRSSPSDCMRRVLIQSLIERR